MLKKDVPDLLTGGKNLSGSKVFGIQVCTRQVFLIQEYLDKKRLT